MTSEKRPGSKLRPRPLHKQLTSAVIATVMFSAAVQPGFAQTDSRTTRAAKNAAASVATSAVIRNQKLKPIDPTSPQVAQGAQLEPVTIMDYRDPETEELIRFQYQPSSPEELRKFVPSKASKIVTVGIPPKLGFAGNARHLLREFPLDFASEYIAFTIAIGIGTTFRTENDPAFALNFIKENTTKEAVISFAGFVGASRATHAAMKRFGWSYDPRRAPLDYRIDTPNLPGQMKMVDVLGDNGQKFQMPIQEPGRPMGLNSTVVASPMDPARGQTRFQKNFAPLLGPIGLMAGMATSNVIHEVLADKGMHLCVKARVFKMKMAAPDTPPDKLKELDEQIAEACDKAWEDWAVSKKAADYTPDLLAMAGASLIQAYLVNKMLISGTGSLMKQGFVAAADRKGIVLETNKATKKLQISRVRHGAEKFKPWVLRGMKVTGFTLTGTPVGRFVFTVFNIAVFMEITHLLTAPIKQPWEQFRQGRDITDRINKLYHEIDRAEKNKWDWQPAPDSDFCADYFHDPMGSVAMSSSCVAPEQYSPDFLLKKMAERKAKWREFLLADAYLAHTNWKNYVSSFATRYASATSFYHQMLAHINEMRNSPPESTALSMLYAATPFYGLYADPEKRDTAGARTAVAEATAWLETYLESARLKARSRSGQQQLRQTERDHLPHILNGLRAMDSNVPLSSLMNIDVPEQQLNALPPELKYQIESQARQTLASDAIRRLRLVLREDPIFNDRSIPPTTPMYRRTAEWNPFMALRLRLGDPEPLAEGVAFIRETNDDDKIIEQLTKNSHPAAIGRVRTNTMADYLAVSMVCGPNAEPQFSKSEQIKIYKDRKLTFFQSILDRFGFGSSNATPTEADVMIAVREHREQVTSSDMSWVANFRPSAVAVEWKGVSADFRPPRVVTGVPEGLCDAWAKGSSRDKAFYDPYDAKFEFNGKIYNGILDIIRQHARPDIVGTSLPPRDKNVPYDDPFVKWWTTNIDKHVVQIVAKFRAKYREVLKEKYIPILTKAGADGSAEYNDQIIKLGALESLYDEAKLYLLILGKTAQVTKDVGARKKFDDLSSGLVIEYKNIGLLASDLEMVEQKGDIANAAFETRRKALEAKLEELKQFVDERQTATKSSDSIVKTNQQALKNLAALMGELDTYWGIIRSIQVKGQ